jgi:hypothetical protein
LLSAQGENLFGTEALQFFLTHDLTKEKIRQQENLYKFSTLTDSDVDCAIKMWSLHSDKVLSELCKKLTARHLPKVEISDSGFSNERVQEMKEKAQKMMGLTAEEVSYFVQTDTLVNKAYSLTGDTIKILDDAGRLQNIYTASDMLSAAAFSNDTTKHFFCYPKGML